MKLGQILRWMIGVLLLPLCFASLMAFALQVGAKMGGSGSLIVSFFAGVAVYVAIFVFFHKSIAGAFFGEKSVERMWSTVTGYRLQDVMQQGPAKEHKDSKGRQVPLWAILLPHLVPITTIIAMLVVWGVHLLVREFTEAWYFRTQAFVVGLTYTFHLFLIGVHIRERHAGLRTAGYLFTLVLVVLVHLQMIALLTWIVDVGPDWIAYNEELWAQAKRVYFTLYYDWVKSL
jgi:hypothetical protein